MVDLLSLATVELQLILQFIPSTHDFLSFLRVHRRFLALIPQEFTWHGRLLEVQLVEGVKLRVSGPLTQHAPISISWKYSELSGASVDARHIALQISHGGASMSSNKDLEALADLFVKIRNLDFTNRSHLTMIQWMTFLHNTKSRNTIEEITLATHSCVGMLWKDYLQELHQLPSLTALTIHHNTPNMHPTDVPQDFLQFLPHLKALKKFTLHDVVPSDKFISEIRHAPLEQLDLGEAQVSTPILQQCFQANCTLVQHVQHLKLSIEHYPPLNMTKTLNTKMVFRSLLSNVVDQYQILFQLLRNACKVLQTLHLVVWYSQGDAILSQLCSRSEKAAPWKSLSHLILEAPDVFDSSKGKPYPSCAAVQAALQDTSVQVASETGSFSSAPSASEATLDITLLLHPLHKSEKYWRPYFHSSDPEAAAQEHLDHIVNEYASLTPQQQLRFQVKWTEPPRPRVRVIHHPIPVQQRQHAQTEEEVHHSATSYRSGSPTPHPDPTQSPTLSQASAASSTADGSSCSRASPPPGKTTPMDEQQ